MSIITTEGDTQSGIIIFVTEDNLRYLFSSNMWSIDGTFQVVPDMFYQPWTGHGKVAGKVFSLVYVLMQNKREEDYLDILQRLHETAGELQIPNIQFSYRPSDCRLVVLSAK